MADTSLEVNDLLRISSIYFLGPQERFKCCCKEVTELLLARALKGS